MERKERKGKKGKKGKKEMRVSGEGFQHQVHQVPKERYVIKLTKRDIFFLTSGSTYAPKSSSLIFGTKTFPLASARVFTPAMV